MTTKQQSLYWRLWGEVCRINRWRFSGGSIDERADLDSSRWHRAVRDAAMARAMRDGRDVDADDLRHGCIVVALGRDKSSSDIKSTGEFTRIVALFRLLKNSDDLSAAMELDEPDADLRRRLVWRIEHAAPLAYILTICRSQFPGKFEAPNWEELPTACLRALATTLSQRTREFRSPIQPVATADPVCA